MIICNTQINGIRYAIWQLTESVSELIDLINGRFTVSLAGITNPVRQQERLAARLLIEVLCDGYQPIDYKENGEPYFTQCDFYLSISHTKNYVAVAVAPFKIGIDIEHTSDRVLRITKKFLNASELDQLSTLQTPTQLALLYWCCKEAFYKKMENQDPEFTHFTCQLSADKLLLQYQESNYCFHFEQTNHYTLVLG